MGKTQVVRQPPHKILVLIIDSSPFVVEHEMSNRSDRLPAQGSTWHARLPRNILSSGILCGNSPNTAARLRGNLTQLPLHSVWSSSDLATYYSTIPFIFLCFPIWCDRVSSRIELLIRINFSFFSGNIFMSSHTKKRALRSGERAHSDCMLHSNIWFS